jgi:hypothetical protein
MFRAWIAAAVALAMTTVARGQGLTGRVVDGAAVLTMFQVSGIPDIWLIDPEGNVALRNLSAESLQAALKDRLRTK